MPSNLPRLNVVMTPEMRQWLEDQRQPCESAAHVVRRIVASSMAATHTLQAAPPSP